jgi:hypothetical protein
MRLEPYVIDVNGKVGYTTSVLDPDRRQDCPPRKDSHLLVSTLLCHGLLAR